MPKNKLFDDEDSDDEVSLKTENEYAKRYDNWRQKEELHKLEQKYGDKALNSEGDSSSDSEDVEPPEMSEEQEEQFLKTLALLKTKDPRIYDPGYKFFNEEQEQTVAVEENVEQKCKPKKEVNSLAAAFAETDDDDDSDGEIFKVEKADPEPQTNKKEEKIKAYLTGAVQHVDGDVERDLAPLKELWSDPKLSEEEAFLRDYILNKKYNMPESEAGPGRDKLLDDAPLDADEQLVEEQGNFERAYNFRFEEPDHEYLKRYPRTMNYIRPKDESRSKKRLETRSRKDEEKRRKMDELARLKALKLQEIQEKLAKIRDVTGNEELAFKDEDIEGEFDPEEHDRRMRAIFDEQYYGHADEQKPEFPDLDRELEIENWDQFEPERVESTHAPHSEGPHCEDEDFNMDADYDPKRTRSTLLEEIQETLGKKRRARRKKSKLAELLSVERPVYVPAAHVQRTYTEHMEQYYALECEDVIAGDLPTRFKYRETVPNSFGLTIEEILLADDKELNRWASLKKTVKYRPEHAERGDVTVYRQRAADERLKRKMLPSLYRHLPQEPEIVVPIETNKKKRKKSKNKSSSVEDAASVATAEETHPNGVNNDVSSQEVNEETGSEVVSKKNKKKKRKNTDPNLNEVDNLPESKLDNKVTQVAEVEKDATNESTQKKKKRKNTDRSLKEVDKLPELKLVSKVTQGNDVEKAATNETTDNKKKKRKKKKKPKQVDAVVENIKKDGPSQSGAIKIVNNNGKISQQKNGHSNVLKRKLDSNQTDGDKNTPKKKRKKNNKQNKPQNEGPKNGFKNKLKNKTSKNYKGNPDNPLSKLSDERLKAFGLNPKKYRSFLKYKKF